MPMAIDFSGLVLQPCMDTFAKPVAFTFTSSQPGAPANQPARGIWDVEHQDVALDGEGVFSQRVISIGIRLAEFNGIQPLQGDTLTIATDDQVTIPKVAPGTSVTFLIDDVETDGQGGATLILKHG